ncbi:hypothetical protein AAKU55_005882 [Oxalobacteraceae bacterium GrIS 1.11]
MNEQVARDVVLVRAIETADEKREVLSEDDRLYASRSAKELAQWQASEHKSAVTADHFLQQRSEQILKRIAERTPSFSPFIRRHNVWLTFSLFMPALALLLGAGLDRITDPHRVDLLSAPLLLTIGWNLLVYAAMLIWACLPLSKMGRTKTALLRKLSVGRQLLPRKLPHALSAGLLSFMAQWAQLSTNLTAARLGRAIHLSAAMFAVGAVLSLYARGFLSQYVAGWESTFFDARQVHAILSVLFLPAVALFHLQEFSITDIEALRFGLVPILTGGARWVHLYAASIFLLVVLPRLALASFANWRVKKLSARFPLDLEQPYFRKFEQAAGGAGGIVRVLPYSFTVDEARDKGLLVYATSLFGEPLRLMLRPSIDYGVEAQDALRDVKLDDRDVITTLVLFNLSATPEKENHGAFLDYLARHSAHGIKVLVDESAYLERIGSQAGGKLRMLERIALWQQFCNFHQAPATIVNLISPSTSDMS